MKRIGIARIYDKKTGHFQCRRRVYVKNGAEIAHVTRGAIMPLYVLRFNIEDGYIYRRIDEKFNVEFV